MTLTHHGHVMGLVCEYLMLVLQIEQKYLEWQTLPNQPTCITTCPPPTHF